MEYPKSWEKEVSAWMNDDGAYGDVVITRDESGPAVHKVKKIDWLATLGANWRSMLAAVAAAAAVAVAVVSVLALVVKACRGK
ncbi:MAG: hypothetical protein LUG44_06580 [Clostridiales bacterium]|nr:hypothetical protein [Clostridiales bacterium]